MILKSLLILTAVAAIVLLLAGLSISLVLSSQLSPMIQTGVLGLIVAMALGGLAVAGLAIDDRRIQSSRR